MLVLGFFSWHRAAGVLTVVAAVFAACGVCFAGDGVRYGRNGKAYPLTRSQTELAIRLGEPQAAGGAKERLSLVGAGRLKYLPGSTPGSRWRLLEVAGIGDKRRNVILADPAIESVQSVWRQTGRDVPFLASGDIVLRTKPGLTDAQRNALFAGYGVRFVRTLPRLRDIYVVEPVVGDGGDDVAIASEMHGDPRVVWAHSDFVCPKNLYQIVPSDTYFVEQWHLNNTGQSDIYGRSGTPGADINVLDAWVITLGTDVLISMYDDACDHRHEDLRENYTGDGFDASLTSSDSGFHDPRPKTIYDRHGTAVMGLAVASANQFGVRGVAPLARFTATGGLARTTKETEDALVYSFALQQNVDIHINSWGYSGEISHPVVEDAILAAFREGRDLDGEGGAAPLGMSIFFATGNGDDDGNAIRVTAETDLSMLPAVIGVGASNADDVVASYSNFGPDIEILAPGGGGGESLPELATVDNTDDFGYPENGYNNGGFDDFGNVNLDPEGKYTYDFVGTSAACPVAAGVAALVLSANRELTATQVRLIIEHTADAVSPEETEYHAVTRFSEKYGYGRINAARAVDAALQAVNNNQQTWPERPMNVTIDTQANVVRWQSNVEAIEYLLVESTDPGFGTTFGFVPRDGSCYVNGNNSIANDPGQFACEELPDELLGDVPQGVTIIHWHADTNRSYSLAEGRKSFGLYARNGAGRYSWGVFIDSDGNVFRAGPTIVIGHSSGGGNGGNGGTTGSPPRVSIDVSPLQGTSPLEVSFKGNAVTDAAIVDYCCYDCNENGVEDAFDIFSGDSLDENFDLIPDECDNNGGAIEDGELIPCPTPFAIDDAVRCTGWDFEDDGAIDTRETTTQHIYTTLPGETMTYRARLTFTDAENRAGSQSVEIKVEPETGGGQTSGSAELMIMISPPGSSGVDLDSGEAPLDAELTIDASNLPGRLVSVGWDLGDGTVASSISVLHTYHNTSDVAMTYPITAQVFTTVPSSDPSGAYFASRLLRVEPEPETPTYNDSNINGSGTNGGGAGVVPCALGIVPLLATMIGLALMRRRFAQR